MVGLLVDGNLVRLFEHYRLTISSIDHDNLYH